VFTVQILKLKYEIWFEDGFFGWTYLHYMVSVEQSMMGVSVVTHVTGILNLKHFLGEITGVETTKSSKNMLTFDYPASYSSPCSVNI
jgi:hypothetical protein